MLDRRKFSHPDVTADGQPRAAVDFRGLETLWFNTGTLCNLECANCYIESSPKNDRLVYLSAEEVIAYLDEIESLGWRTAEIGFTGGEPFMNPDFIAMLDETLARGYRVLVLTNAMKPMQHKKDALRALRDKHGADRLTLRVSIDHYTRARHEEERGAHSWAPMIDGLRWLGAAGFTLNLAGRTFSGETEADLRAGYARLIGDLDLPLDAHDPVQLVLFPEMDEKAEVPEITTGCWGLLGVDPGDMMCATSRMVVKHKGADRPSVMACTLLAYDREFDLGPRLEGAAAPVKLNHIHCAKFCVLGGGACSA